MWQYLIFKILIIIHHVTSFWKLVIVTETIITLCVLLIYLVALLSSLCLFSIPSHSCLLSLLFSPPHPLTPQTRIADWREGALNGVYLRRRLQEAAEHIKYYELNATPKGWSCHWDRYALLTFHISKLPRPPQILPCDYTSLSAEVADFVTWLGEKLIPVRVDQNTNQKQTLPVSVMQSWHCAFHVLIREHPLWASLLPVKYTCHRLWGHL